MRFTTMPDSASLAPSQNSSFGFPRSTLQQGAGEGRLANKTTKPGQESVIIKPN